MWASHLEPMHTENLSSPGTMIRAGSDPISSSLHIAASYETMHDSLTTFHGFKMNLWTPSIHGLKWKNTSCLRIGNGDSPHRI